LVTLSLKFSGSLKLIYEKKIIESFIIDIILLLIEVNLLEIGSIDSGSIKLKVLATNTTSVTLLSDKKFKGKVIQPGATGNKALGEHGFSMNIELLDNGKKFHYLIDTGGLAQTIFENSKLFGINLSTIEKLVLTHGHYDHFGGLLNALPLFKTGTEVIINPNCYLQNIAIIPKPGIELPKENIENKVKELESEGKILTHRKLLLLKRDLIMELVEQQKLKLIETSKPFEIHNGIVTSGEIELFDKEEVTKNLFIQQPGMEVKRQDFRDETAVYINVKDKGLVVITGCGHCGIMNIIKHGQKLTGVKKIYGVIGGFHEEWNSLDVIQNKINYFNELNPEIICGMHCTGFIFNKLMSDHPAHTLGVVGTEFHL
jgi:7,8-dihydropterin-6-yl-methyl-4-(beta-D-ribofuranosyl)aminobenzene 5'-phosphate synthase